MVIQVLKKDHIDQKKIDALYNDSTWFEQQQFYKMLTPQKKTEAKTVYLSGRATVLRNMATAFKGEDQKKFRELIKKYIEMRGY
jgi:hypothetical protein